jgi:hypothetical protein
MFDAILTGMEAALLRARGLPTPKVDLLDNGRDWVAVIVREERRIEALGSSPEAATRKVIRMAVER